jgi:hypothetical protein
MEFPPISSKPSGQHSHHAPKAATVRYIRALHDLKTKTIRLRSDRREPGE